jgi:hypothetical protein
MMIIKKKYFPLILTTTIITVLASTTGCNITPQETATQNVPNIPEVVTTTAPSSTIPDTFFQAPVIIDTTFNGREVYANLVKFTGFVSSSDASVFLNKNQANVNSDGSYYAYLSLVPGKNTYLIETITNQSSSSENFTVSFIQPLVIRLYYPNRDASVDYRKVPLSISGTVSDPTVKVEVNKHQVSVDSDLTFTSQVQLKEGKNSVQATAIRGNETDSDVIGLEVFDNGMLAAPPPGFGSEFTSHFVFDNPVVEIETGQTISLDFAFQANKDIPIAGSSYTVALTRCSALGTQDKLPIPSSLVINLNPSAFMIYPKIEYHSLIDIKAGLDLVPADYYFRVVTNSGRLGGAFYFTVSVRR